MKTGVPVGGRRASPFARCSSTGSTPALADPTVPALPRRRRRYSKATSGRRRSGPRARGDPLRAGDRRPRRRRQVEIVVSTWAGTIYVVDAHGQAPAGLAEAPPARAVVPARIRRSRRPAPCMDLEHGLARGTFARPCSSTWTRTASSRSIQAAFDGNIYVVQGGRHAARRVGPCACTRRSAPTDRPHHDDADGRRLQRRRHPRGRHGLERDGRRRRRGRAGLRDRRPRHHAESAAGRAVPAELAVTVRASIHLFPVVAEGITSSQAAADFDGDGVDEIGVLGNGSPPLVVKADPGVQNGFDDPPNQVSRASRRREHRAPEARLRSDEHLRRELAREPAGHDVPALRSRRSAISIRTASPTSVMSGGVAQRCRIARGRQRHAAIRPAPPRDVERQDGQDARRLADAIEDYTFLTSRRSPTSTATTTRRSSSGRAATSSTPSTRAAASRKAGRSSRTGGSRPPRRSATSTATPASLEVVTATRDGYLFAWHTKGRPTGVDPVGVVPPRQREHRQLRARSSIRASSSTPAARRTAPRRRPRRRTT